MITRTITGAALVAVLVGTVYFLPPIAMPLLFAAMAAAAAHELLYRTGLVHHVRLVVYSMTAAFLGGLWCYVGMPHSGGLLGVVVFTIVVLCELLHAHAKLDFQQIAFCYAAGLLIPYLLGSLVRIHNMQTGQYDIVIPFLIAFLSDTGAYLTGRLFGKHKLAPIISPKKTVEGLLGGVVSGIVGMLVYGWILERFFHMEVHYGFALVYGVAGSLGGVLGDLGFSVIKRQTGIKDYGFVLPGHGGILDRFDSMVIVGPLVEALLLLLPWMVKI